MVDLGRIKKEELVSLTSSFIKQKTVNGEEYKVGNLGELKLALAPKIDKDY